MSDIVDANDQLVLICGYSGTGKTASLRNIRNPENWLYLNTEAGKRCPFKSKFREYKVDDPLQVLEAFDYASDPNMNVQGIIVDSLTFLLDQYESKYVLTASNTMKAWSDFQQFFKTLMQDKVIKFNKPTIFIAHVADQLDETSMEVKTFVPVKGALKNQGIEAYFSVVVAAKKLPLKTLASYKSDLLHITEEDEDLGFKHVFQTRITKNTTGERIRGPMGLFTKNETFMDNDAQLLLDKLNNYYGE